MTRRDMLIQRVRVLAICFTLLSSACDGHFRQKQSLRVDSFKPCLSRTIEGDAAKDFLTARVALLFTNKNFSVQTGIKDGHVVLPAGVTDFGCATAIDPRGYYLTAAHCLAKEGAFLLQWEAGKGCVMQTRQVWRDDANDWAILHVPHPMGKVFALADETQAGDAVMAVGLAWGNSDPLGLIGFEPMGGRILSYKPSSSSGTCSHVSHDLPLQSGDSGGPLLDEAGRLIGINIGGTPPIGSLVLPKRLFPAKAVRPSREQLREIIEQDLATPPPDQPAHK